MKRLAAVRNKRRYDMNIGYFSKKIRTDKSLTLNEDARSTEMTASLISQIDNEKVYPSLNSLEAIILYYGRGRDRKRKI